MRALEKPLLAWDGDCGFCRRSVERWRGITGDQVDDSPYQEIAADFPEIPREDFIRSVVLIEPGGRVSRGAEAVFRALAHSGRGQALWMYRRVPGFAPVSEAAYRAVARNRGLLSRFNSSR